MDLTVQFYRLISHVLCKTFPSFTIQSTTVCCTWFSRDSLACEVVLAQPTATQPLLCARGLAARMPSKSSGPCLRPVCSLPRCVPSALGIPPVPLPMLPVLQLSILRSPVLTVGRHKPLVPQGS